MKMKFQVGEKVISFSCLDKNRRPRSLWRHTHSTPRAENTFHLLFYANVKTGRKEKISYCSTGNMTA